MRSPSPLLQHVVHEDSSGPPHDEHHFQTWTRSPSGPLPLRVETRPPETLLEMIMLQQIEGLAEKRPSSPHQTRFTGQQ